jgi:Tfp pilus assembly protein PilX
MMDVRRDEEGSIVLMMLIMLVVTALVVTTIAVTQQGLRTSRRAGDSANALQVADAAINEALAEIPRVAGATFSRSKALGVDVWPGSCPTGRDCYTFTATRDLGPRRSGTSMPPAPTRRV